MGPMQLPAWQLPNTVLCVDDNRKYLNSLRLVISSKHIAPLFIDAPEAALQLVGSQKNDNLMTKLYSKSDHEAMRLQSIDINLNVLHQEIYNPGRFKHIAVIVVDYAMPGMNGIDFAAQVRLLNPKIKILMLTGEADEKLAVDAFNQGVIDKFLRKNEVNFQEQLNEIIEFLQRQYFQELTELFLKGIDEQISHFFTLASNAEFVKVFKTICQQFDIVEYYLLDLDGSFLMLSFDGTPFILAVKTKESMEDAYQVAFHADTKFPSEILESMKEKRKILYLYDQDICDESDEAKKFLHESKVIEGSEPLYYALIENLSNYPIKTDEILSFRQYLEQV